MEHDMTKNVVAQPGEYLPRALEVWTHSLPQAFEKDIRVWYPFNDKNRTRRNIIQVQLGSLH
jgi:hypothetical protein